MDIPFVSIHFLLVYVYCFKTSTFYRVHVKNNSRDFLIGANAASI